MNSALGDNAMRIPKLLFSYRRSRYYIGEICLAILLSSLAISFATTNTLAIRFAFIIIPFLLMALFAVEGIGTIKPLLHKGSWGTAIVHFLPYLLAIMIGIIFIVRVATTFYS